MINYDVEDDSDFEIGAINKEVHVLEYDIDDSDPVLLIPVCLACVSQ